MINYWVKHNEIDLYVKLEVDTVVFVDNESMLAVACLQFGGDGNEGGEGAEGLDRKGDDVVVSEGGESDGGGEERVDVAVSEGGKSDG
ncbi:hypothetical protein Gotri_026473 [Gossypium trilobum]|uniref:Uncharacterized protein n=1 Tax=Gossypium trilobum TaxID=34281 RepID=A0A7J9FV69_9ROSI|nr:hypothetical protein [Gossypium trilobum]